MKEIKVNASCPSCNTSMNVSVDIDQSMLAPTVRGKLTPAENIYVYRVTSEEIKQFIIQKAKKYVPDVKVEVVPRYCERKRRKSTDPRRSYASLRIAFSNEIIEKNSDQGWFGKIGENGSNVRVVNSLFNNLIRMYQYNKKEIDSWLKSYKNLEELEETLGMTEAYINDLRMYATPQRIKSNNEDWIIFSAAAENVLTDMLTDVETGKVPGKMIIHDIFPISKDIVEFVIHLYPENRVMKEDPHVRQILLGEEKAKK